MTFEERLERLTERQDALAQSVEILYATVRHNVEEHELERSRDRVERDKEMQALREFVYKVAQSVDTLARVVGLHDDRLDEHDKRLEDLEGPR